MAANYAKQLEDYFKNIPQEELDREFSELSNIGSGARDSAKYVEDYLRFMEEKYGKIR